MKWFDNWFRRKCKEAWMSRDEPEIFSPGAIAVKSSPYRSGLDSNGLSLSIYSADGGTVMEFRHYDHHKDRSDYTLHVIGQNENFEERVAQAITMEMLRRGLAR